MQGSAFLPSWCLSSHNPWTVTRMRLQVPKRISVNLSAYRKAQHVAGKLSEVDNGFGVGVWWILQISDKTGLVDMNMVLLTCDAIWHMTVISRVIFCHTRACQRASGRFALALRWFSWETRQIAGIALQCLWWSHLIPGLGLFVLAGDLGLVGALQSRAALLFKIQCSLLAWFPYLSFCTRDI